MVNTGHTGACWDWSDLIGWEGNEWCTHFPGYICQSGGAWEQKFWALVTLGRHRVGCMVIRTQEAWAEAMLSSPISVHASFLPCSSVSSVAAGLCDSDCILLILTCLPHWYTGRRVYAWMRDGGRVPLVKRLVPLAKKSVERGVQRNHLEGSERQPWRCST